MRFILFSSVFLVVMTFMNVYSWRRFLRLLSYDKRGYLVLIPIGLLLGDVFFIVDIATNIIPDSPFLYLVSSSFVGFTFMLFVISIIYDMV